MFSYLTRKLRFLNFVNAQNQNNTSAGEIEESIPLAKTLQKNLDQIQQILGKSADIVVRQFQFGHGEGALGALIYVDGLVDKKTISDDILKPLMYLFERRDKSNMSSMDQIQMALLSVGDVQQENTMAPVLKGVLGGSTLLLIDGFQEVLLLDTKGWQSRGIEEPTAEQVVRGPREGFNETIRFNTALLRRKIQNTDFRIEQMTIGTRTRTTVALAYINGVVNPSLIDEIKRRLQRIEVDAILESGYIEQYIEDAPYSPFSTVGNSERPDVIAAKVLEGRVAILVDGTPIVLTVPMFFIEGFQASEDYYSRPFYASLVRSIRFLAFIISLLAPATYVALTSYHPELIPRQLMLTMAAASIGTPFPAVLESLGMGVVFEILREGGIRLPSAVGQAISIVGVLIIGDAAIQAGIVGAPLIIVVGITAVSSFLTVAHIDAGTVLRFLLVVLAGVLGAFGMICGLIAILVHLCSLRSFGAPYLSPLAPLIPEDLGDTFIRAPLWALITRPHGLGVLDPQRQAFRLKPGPTGKTRS